MLVETVEAAKVVENTSVVEISNMMEKVDVVENNDSAKSNNAVESNNTSDSNTALESNNAAEYDLRCHVCFYVNSEPYVMLKCRHTICAGCVGRWFLRKTSCVMCRTKIEELEIDEELKAKALEHLQENPDKATPAEIKYEQLAYETIFWAIQMRKLADDPDLIFYGPKPTNILESYSAKEKSAMVENVRLFRIRERLETLRQNLGVLAPLAQIRYNLNFFEKMFYDNDPIYRDEDQEWRMVHGRGLVRVPRSTNRNYCPIRFRRSHST
ncbi:unnamed protein product [Caenorhabditis brenneri]